MITADTKPGTKVRVANEFHTLAEVLSTIHPAYHQVSRLLYEQGKLTSRLKLGAVFVVETIVDLDIPICGYGVVLREVEGTYPAETFEVVS